MIHHITTPAVWQTALNKGFYEVASLQTEGFIHCCKQEQLEGVIKRYYSDIMHLLVLDIDESRLSADIIYQPSALVDEMFPHVYGTINLDAVVAMHPLTNHPEK